MNMRPIPMWTYSHMQCLSCFHVWIGTYELTCDVPETFECPECHEMTGVRDEQE